MQAVLFSGIQAAGKSSFFKARLADSHVRINLDMLRTRHREHLLLTACLAARQAFVVDNTNLTVAERASYIELARSAGFTVVGYRFFVELDLAISRNAQRAGPKPIPEKALRGALRRWEPPRQEEGFDQLFDVRATDGAFLVEPAGF